MYLCCFLLITSEIFQLTNKYRYQFVEEAMTDIFNTKEIIQRATLGTPKGMKKYNFYFYYFWRWYFDQRLKYNFRGTNKTKKH